MTTQDSIGQIVKTLRKQAQDNLAMADFMEALTITEAPVPEAPAHKK